MAAVCTSGLGTGFIEQGNVVGGVMGAILGATEALPVSADAHRHVVPALFGWAMPGPALIAAVQIAVALAIVVHLRRELVDLARGTIAAGASGEVRGFEVRLVIGVVAAAVPVILFGGLLRRHFVPCTGSVAEGWTIGIAAIATAAVLLAADLTARETRGWDDLRLRDAAVAAVVQLIALVPGVSAITALLIGALAMRLDRASAVRFALLAALPSLIVTGIGGLSAMRKLGIGAAGWQTTGVALGAAFVAAVAGVALLRLVTAWLGAWPFVIHRLVVGGLLAMVAWLVGLDGAPTP